MTDPKTPMPAMPAEDGAPYRRTCEIFGNGDAQKGRQIIYMLAARLDRARILHPVFARDAGHAFKQVAGEFHELKFAMERESPARQKAEGLDLLMVTLRYVLEEWAQGGA